MLSAVVLHVLPTLPISPRVARDRCRHVLFSRKLLLATYGAHALCTHCRRHQMLMCTSVFVFGESK